MTITEFGVAARWSARLAMTTTGGGWSPFTWLRFEARTNQALLRFEAPSLRAEAQGHARKREAIPCNRVRNDEWGAPDDGREQEHGSRLRFIAARIWLVVCASLRGDCFGVAAR